MRTWIFALKVAFSSGCSEDFSCSSSERVLEGKMLGPGTAYTQRCMFLTTTQQLSYCPPTGTYRCDNMAEVRSMESAKHSHAAILLNVGRKTRTLPDASYPALMKMKQNLTGGIIEKLRG